MGYMHRFVRLTLEQDAQLRDVEKNPLLNAKVRLRASIVRLSNQNFSLSRLCLHFGRSERAVRNDLRRYEQHGLAGLADGKSPGAPSLFTAEMTAFVQEKLLEDRIWNCALLLDATLKRFGVRVERETMRLKVRSLGYSWKRTKYVPSKTPNPEVLAEHQASLETLKKGLEQAS